MPRAFLSVFRFANLADRLPHLKLQSVEGKPRVIYLCFGLKYGCSYRGAENRCTGEPLPSN
jgi:hypothetical protein